MENTICSNSPKGIWQDSEFTVHAHAHTQKKITMTCQICFRQLIGKYAGLTTEKEHTFKP